MRQGTRIDGMGEIDDFSDVMNDHRETKREREREEDGDDRGRQVKRP